MAVIQVTTKVNCSSYQPSLLIPFTITSPSIMLQTSFVSYLELIMAQLTVGVVVTEVIRVVELVSIIKQGQLAVVAVTEV